MHQSREDCRHPLQLPELLVERAKAGQPVAPTLREIVEADGTRYAVLDFIVEVPVERDAPLEAMNRVLGFDWGVRMLVTASVVDLEAHQLGRPLFLDTGPFDGRQARLRRQIDYLTAKVARLEQQRDRFPMDDSRRGPPERALSMVRREISRCWRKYEARNNDLAHLAANILLVLAQVFECQLIAGESLKTLKSAGRGRDAKGRWRNWRNNSQIRGALCASCGTSVSLLVFTWSGSTLATRRISVLAVGARRLRSPRLDIAHRRPSGEPGSAAPLPPVAGTGPATMQPRSISPAWAQP